MRFFLTAVILTMLSQPVAATTIESLYENCKPFADRGFENSEPDDVIGLYADALCIGYMVATVEQLNSLCDDYQRIKKDYSDRPDLVLGFRGAAMLNGTSAELEDLNAVIQTFVNFAGANPDKWDSTPLSFLWLKDIFPCKE